MEELYRTFHYKGFTMEAIWVEKFPNKVFGNIAPNNLFQVKEVKGDDYEEEADIIGLNFKDAKKDFEDYIDWKLQGLMLKRGMKFEERIIYYKGQTIYIDYIEDERRFQGTISTDLGYKTHSKDYSKLVKHLKDYIDRSVIKKEKVIESGKKALLEDFSFILYNYPEALPEIIEFITRLQDKYKD